ncbi:hypothetical protein ACKVMT_08670 [Halobacteriales archaeon Cl-PHB]
MYGVVTRNAEEVTRSTFDSVFYEVKDVTGRTADPVPESTSMISCFGDNRVGENRPELVPVSAAGERATRDRTYFDWDYVCPSATDYRTELLDRIESAAAVTGDLRLDDVGFPRAEYCHCDRCDTAFADSDHDDRGAWRAAVITDFVAAARDRVPGTLYLTLYPDPYPGHLFERAGLDTDALADYVDEFVVPLYDLHYGTTYWLETIASGFVDALAAPLCIELYAINVEEDNLVHAAEVAETYADRVLFAYDADAAEAVIARRREATSTTT